MDRNTLYCDGKEYRLITAFRGIGDNQYATEFWPKWEGARTVRAYDSLLDAKHGHLEVVEDLVKSGVFYIVDELWYGDEPPRPLLGWELD